MKIDCLMGTYGRHSLVCESLACFLQQSLISNATLLIYNQHPVPLSFEHPRVRIVNEQLAAGPLRYIRQRMLALADPSAELIHFWEDDDLYLPWHLEDCMKRIGDNAAWKPAKCWMSMRNTQFSCETNMFEGSWVFRAEHLKAAPFDTHPDYIDHPAHLQTLEAGRLASTDLGGRTSYIYRWANGSEHLSGYGGQVSEQVQRDNALQWRMRSNDFRPDGELVPADLGLRWQQYLAGIRELVSPAEWILNARRVGLQPWR
jgi:hypothetical protein